MTSDSTSARGGAARGAPIKLRDAPASLFADDFARLAALKGGEKEALEALDRPDPGILAFYRREALASGALAAGRRREVDSELHSCFPAWRRRGIMAPSVRKALRSYRARSRRRR